MIPKDEYAELAIKIPNTVSNFENLNIPEFSECVKMAQKDFDDWNKKVNPKTELQYTASYILWCNTVSKMGNYKDDVILCSKRVMDATWAWDNVFMALGIAKSFPEMAFYQFMIFYDNLDEFGAMADYITPSFISRLFVKPPVHGFVYRWCMEKNPYFSDIKQIKRIYTPMKKNTMWWLNCRGEWPYTWHGNDSGADNSTACDADLCIVSPSTLGYLSSQCELLAEFAEKLGKKKDKEFFESKSKELAKQITTEFFDGERIFVRKFSDNQPWYSYALMPMLSLTAGKNLERSFVEKMAKTIKEDFLCEYGCPSESKKSSKYVAGNYESYWRGSIWAPEQLLLYRSLMLLGYNELADNILDNYIRALSIGGCAENSNAEDGSGNCDKAYGWTAAAVLVQGEK